MDGLTTDRRRLHKPHRSPVWQDLYDAIEAMLVGDCLQWRCSKERLHTLSTSVTRRVFANGAVVRCIWHEEIVFLVRVA